jgi:hypothetical protein
MNGFLQDQGYALRQLRKALSGVSSSFLVPARFAATVTERGFRFA